MDLVILTKSLEFAAQKHASQRRKGASKIPYINHPIEVLNILCQCVRNPNPELLVAAVLHDTLEDTNTTEDELKKNFNPTVLSIVQEVTDDMTLSSKKRKKLQILKAASLSDSAKCIKIADKACNIRDILYTRILWDIERKVKYILWAEEVVNNCRGVCTELENKFDEIVGEAKKVLKF